jgi:multiple sugar transport system substrate-binding protein
MIKSASMRGARLAKALLGLMLGFAVIGCKGPQKPEKPVELTLAWHSGGLGELLIDLSKEYTKQTGVVVRGRLLPWAEWHDKIAAEFAVRGSGYDLVVFDSQSMSEFASQDHVVLLNPYLDKSSKIKAADFEVSALRTYAEYPDGSGKLYALPVNQDAMGLVYRTDLFGDSKEKAAFRARYGYELAVPQTYNQLRDIAEFFTRPEQNLYGIALYGSQDYDGVTSAFNNVLWSFGGDLWNPETRKANGVINSPVSLAALQFYKNLFNYSPPGATRWYYNEVNEAIHQGRAAMGINWFYFFSAHADPKISRFADRLGFALLPGQKDADGKFRQYNSVGGQGISISKYSRHVEEAWRFLEWFMSRDIQWRWVRGGGQTGRIDILSHPEYTRATLYNGLFPMAMSRVKDYWHLVQYPQLLAIYQRHVHSAVTGAVSPREALDQVAQEHQAILNEVK